MNFRDIKKILVIKLRHIGDVVLTIPVFRALREHFPNASIVALVNSGTEEVLSGNPLINEIILFNRGIKRQNPLLRYSRELSFLRTIRKKGFDMVVDLTSGDRAALLSFLSGARYRIAHDPGRAGFFGKRYLYTHLAKKQSSQHMVLWNLDVIRQFGIDTENLRVDLFIPEDAKMFAKRVLDEGNINRTDTIVHFHPTSRWLFKCWKDGYVAEVMNWLIKSGVKVIVTSSAEMQEIDKVKNILSLISPHQSVIDLTGKTTIKQLAAISDVSDVFIGVDSAPMHIAAAVGTPVIAIFGTGESSWRPWGENHVVISKRIDNREKIGRKEYIQRNLAQITPEDVIKEIIKIIIQTPKWKK